jgi:type 1 glutamine amidotransferase
MKPRVLVIAGDRYHPAEPVIGGFRAATRDRCEFDLFDGDFSKPASGYAAIALAKLNAQAPKGANLWTDDGLDWLLHAVSDCKALLVVHAGNVGYPEPIQEIVGGKFLLHPEPLDVTFQPTGSHELATGGFTIHDEHYFMETRAGVEVFLESHSERGVQPAGWVRQSGGTRVCVLTPGHFAEVWQHPAFQSLLANALDWVVTGATSPKE